MVKKKQKKSDKFIMVDVGIEVKALIVKLTSSKYRMSISDWVREAIIEKLAKDGIQV